MYAGTLVNCEIAVSVANDDGEIEFAYYFRIENDVAMCTSSTGGNIPIGVLAELQRVYDRPLSFRAI